MKEPWKERMAPFRIFGNLYFAGTIGASSHLIDTGEGLIMIDSGYPQTLYLVVESLWELGFKPSDVKYIVHSHGHYDHLGATRALLGLTDAKTFLGKEDLDYANGKRDLTWARELGHVYHESFVPDVLLGDGDEITLGSVTVRCLHTPGHTPGTMSYFFDASDGIRTFRAGMHGGVGLNSMTRSFLLEHGLPLDCREKFLAGLERLKQEPVDLFIGNHTGNNDTQGKYKRMLAGEKDAFIDPSEWGRFLDGCAERTRKMLAEEEASPGKDS